MNKNRLKKICVLSVFMAIFMYMAVFRNNIFENFRNINYQTVNSTIIDENQVAYVVTLKYMYQNGTLADSKDVYVFDSDNKLDIDIPSIDGYTPSINRISEQIDENFIERIGNLDYVEISKQEGTNIYRIYYTITYVPAPSSYKVVHYLQNTNSTYSKYFEKSFSDNIFIGDVVETEKVEYEGYHLNEEKSLLKTSVNKEGTTELSLYYDRNEKYIYLDSNGGTYYEPVPEIYGNTINLNSYRPQRAGYNFSSWQCIDKATGNVITAPTTMPNEDIYFKAVWSATNTKYVYSYYVENANDNEYRNIGTYEVTAKSGTEIRTLNTNTIQTGFRRVKSDYAYFTYDETTTREKSKYYNTDTGAYDIVVKGDGSTVLNIYYSRNTYNISFNLVSSGNTLTMNGINYTTDSDMYTFNAKYEADISFLWPTYDNFTRFAYSNRPFTGWSGGSSNSTYTSKRLNLTKELISSSTLNSTTTYRANYNYSSKSSLYYLFESFDQSDTTTSATRRRYNGKYYESQPEYYQTAYSQNTNWSAKDLQGVTNVGKNSSSSNYYFYYDRNEFKVTFYNVNEIEKEATVLYQQGVDRTIDSSGTRLMDVVPSSYPVITPGEREYVFKGWYRDTACTIPMKWIDDEGNYTKIIGNLNLYALWEPPTYDVHFNVNSGMWKDTSTEYVLENGYYVKNVEESSTISAPIPPEKNGYDFKGWYYTNENGVELEYLFSESQQVYSDIELTAKWEAKSEGTYIVKYILAEFDNNGNLITDLNKYKNLEYLLPDKVVNNVKYGTNVTETAEQIEKDGINMLIVDGYEKQITLKISENVEDNVIYFFYCPQNKVSYTVYYLKDVGKRYNNGDIPSENEYLLPSKEVTLTTLDNLFVTEQGVEIDGYEIDAYIKNQVLESKSLTLSPTDNSIFFYYSPIERKGDYEINYFFMKEDGTYSQIPDFTKKDKDSVGKYIKITDYYDYLPNTDPLYKGHEFDSDSTKALLAIVASNSVAKLDLYFKNSIYTVSYDTNGGNWNDTNAIFSQLSSNVYSTKVQYNNVAPKPTEPTRDNYRFLGWYDKKTDALYDFNTKLEDDTELYAKWMELKDITIKKVWIDNNNQDGKRPESIDVYIKFNEENIKFVTLTSQEGWSKVVSGLDRYDELGNEITYSIEEIPIDAYTVEYKNQNNIYTITNTHTIETKSLNIEKIWDDQNNQDGKRPDKVEVVLRQNEEIYDTLSLTKENNWNHEIEVPVYLSGIEAIYSVEEVLAEGYTSSVEYNGNNIKITNTYIPETKSITIEKIWNDQNNQDGKRPKNIIVLVKNGEQVVEEVTLGDNVWTKVINNLPVYQEGKKINYIVEEVKDENYDVTYSSLENHYIVTNTYIPETKSVKVTKVWNDQNNQDGIRPESINVVLKANGILEENIELSENNNWERVIENLPVYSNGVAIEYTVDEEKTNGYTTKIENTTEGFNVINTHEVEKTSVNVSKIWVDNNNQDGKRPSSVNVSILANGTIIDTKILSDDNNWKYTWNDLDKNYAGENIKYTVEEENVPYYELTTNYNENTNTWELTNTHIPEIKTITVNKIWNDDNNRDGKRPENLKITLNKNGVEYKNLILNDESDWLGSFENLEVYENNGQIINYEVLEEDIENYTSVKTNTENGYTFTNAHIPERENKTVTKIWRDGSNKDNTRPDSIKFRLLKNGEYISDVITLTAANSNGNFDEWEYTFDNLYVYENGEKIKYTIEEIEVPSGYGVIYNQSKLRMYNAYPPELKVAVEKVWDDENNADGIRPESISVELYADGVPYVVDGQNVGYATLNAENNWSYEWPFVEKYNSEGERYNYTLEEVDVGNSNYTTNIEVKDSFNPEFEFTYVVTNSYVPQKTYKTVTKVWNDNNNQDGKRPENVTVRLLANGNEIANTKLSEANAWTYTFDNINVNENGKPINYTVTEDIVEDYDLSINYNGVDTFTLTNNHVPEKKNINIEKIWDDNDNQDGKRPESIDVKLKADGTEIGTYSIKETENWFKTISDLDVYKNGKEIVYTIEELQVPEYDVANISRNGDNYIIRNIHEPEKIAINIEKVWDDADNRDGIRPANVILSLKAENEIIKDNIILNKSSNWQTRIDNLDKYKNGIKINYTVEEVNIEGYSSKYNYDEVNSGKIVVTNKHNPTLKTINIRKVWEDENNLYNKRPDNVLVDLYANGNLIDTITLEESSNYETVIGGLYQKESGKDIVYSVREHENEFYTNNVETIDNAIIITNTIKTYNVKTRVNGVGGRISGQSQDYYEKIAYNDSSVKDIDIVPNKGYKISKITINDVEQNLPEDTTIKYTLPKFDKVTENKNIVVEFSKIEYKITTRVIGGQGTISGEGQDPYEIVKYAENSKNPIVIIPDTYYEISKITINGVEQELPEDVTIAYTLDNFKSVEENKHIEVEFKRIEATLITKYETKDGKKLHADIEEKHLLGDEYKTEELSFENYVLIAPPHNSSGIVESVITEVKYIYEYRPNIYITEKIKGNYSNIDKRFNLNVIITNSENIAYKENLKYNIVDENDNALYTGEIINGNGMIEIGHNEKLSIFEVPENLVYTIREIEATDYDTEINGALIEDKTISGIVDNNIRVDFVNIKDFVSPTGIILNILPFGVGTIIVILFVALIIKNKKKNIDD